MSLFNLRKASNRILWNDTKNDWRIVNGWRTQKGLNIIIPKTQSLRSLENAIAMMIDISDLTGLPELVRGISFYQSILPEIK